MTTPGAKKHGPGRPRTGRRQEILTVAGQVIAEKGFDRATVRDIADRAGILSGSLYHHFDSKESMLEEFLRGYLDSLIASYEQIAFTPSGGPRETLRAMLNVGFSAVVDHRVEIRILDKTSDLLSADPRFEFVDRAFERVMHLWVGVIASGQRAGVFRDDLDAQIIYRMLMASIFGTVNWFRPDGAMSIEEVADQCGRLYMTGLTSA